MLDLDAFKPAVVANEDPVEVAILAAGDRNAVPAIDEIGRDLELGEIALGFQPGHGQPRGMTGQVTGQDAWVTIRHRAAWVRGLGWEP